MHISEEPKLVTIFGGSGFIGRHLVRELANRGYRIRVAVRRPELAYYLRPLGNVGQIQTVQANVRYRDSVERAVEGAHAVVNLVGILREDGRQTFTAVQQIGARHIAEAAQAARAILIHGSAIGADPQSDSGYARSKGAAEQVVLEQVRKAVVLRPSIVFGPQDSFFNRFAAMARFSPFLPLIGGGKTKFQPVFVGDVARMAAHGIQGGLRFGNIYELGGPQIVTFRECMELMLSITKRRRILLPIPWFAARTLARLTGWLPGAPLTTDQVRQLRRDNIVSPEAEREGRTLAAAGISPKAMEVILPTYLVHYRPYGQFSRGVV